MTKKNSIDLSVPQRQSYVAILLIIYKAYSLLIKQLWPFLLIFVLKGSGAGKGIFMSAIIGVAGLSMVVSIIRYFRFYFYVTDDELIVEKGVISKKRVSVLLSRIQNIDTEQNLIHKLLNVEKLNVETAGSSKKEFEFDALTSPVIAALKKRILINKQEAGDQLDLQETSIPNNKISIFKLSISNLLLAGITQNHLTSFGIIFGFFFWIYETSRDVGVELDEYGEKIISLNPSISSEIILIIILLIVSIMISMIRTVLKYYDLHFYKENKNTYKVKSGLFKVTESAAPINKIQMITWSYNILQKLLKIYDLSIRQAVSDLKSIKKSFTVIGCKIQHVNEFVADLYPKFKYNESNNRDIDIRYFYRLAKYFSITIIISLILLYFKINTFGWALLLLSLFGIVNAFIYQKKKKYGIYNGFLYSKGGVYGESFALLPIYKIQSIKIKQSPYQTRRGLATLVVMTASGQIKIPYILHDEAIMLSNAFMKEVETSRLSWM